MVTLFLAFSICLLAFSSLSRLVVLLFPCRCFFLSSFVLFTLLLFLVILYWVQPHPLPPPFYAQSHKERRVAQRVRSKKVFYASLLPTLLYFHM